MTMAYTSNENIGKVRIKAIRMVLGGKSTREVARYFGYAQSTIVKWMKRKDEVWHQQSLPTKSSRPKSSPAALPKDIVAKVIAVRIQTKRCAEVVHHLLQQQGIEVSHSSVKRIIDRHGLTNKRSPWKKRRYYPLRPDIAQQGDLVEFDTVHFVDKYGKRSYVYTAIDVYSRYGYAMLSEKSNTHTTLKFLRKVKKYFPFTIRCIQTDNGPEFGKWFTDHCNITNRKNHPRSPNENGHLERFNRTLQEEIGKFHGSIHVPEHVRSFLEYYNHERVHMGIDFKTPAQMLTK